MANYLLLNQPQVFNGLGTLSFTIPQDGTYNVQAQITVPEALATGDGGGSGKGLGSGVGGGTLYGFAVGGAGTGHGAVGQGFGADTSGYQQPPSYGSNATSGSVVSSSLAVVVNKNGSPIYTAPTFTATQSALQFKTSFVASATDAITVVLSSSAGSDNALNGVTSVVSIGEGQ